MKRSRAFDDKKTLKAESKSKETDRLEMQMNWMEVELVYEK